MHDTALRIGALAIKAYAGSNKPSILEVGSQIVNGSLRDSAPAGAKWVGVDIEEGDGVDIVVQPGAPLPLDDDRFDLVIATSVFEHDPAFWHTFVEMTRKAKPGGFVYVSAPSNGMVHRYPRDYWRFYPDAGLALVEVAKAAGVEVELVESFIADQEEAGWNDFCAIFRRAGVDRPLPDDFVYLKIPCANVLTWQSRDVIHEREATEDQARLKHELANVQHLIRVNEEDRRSAAAERQVWEAAREALARSAAEGMVAKERLSLLEGQVQSTHNQRVADLEQAIHQEQVKTSSLSSELEVLRSAYAELEKDREMLLNELEKERAAKDGFSKAWTEMNAEFVELQARSKQADEWVFTLSAERRRAEEDRDQMESRLQSLHEQLSKLLDELRISEVELSTTSEDLRETKRELSILKRSLRENETLARQRDRQLQWLRKVEEIIATNASGWRNAMPSSWRRKNDLETLRRHGLFDHSTYLERYPDVGAAGMDPLQHYILHGMTEGRLATFTAD